MRRGAGEDSPIRQTTEGKDLGLLQLGQGARAEGGCDRVNADLEDPAVGTGAQQPGSGPGGFERPEQVGGKFAGQGREHGAGDQTSIGSCRQAF